MAISWMSALKVIPWGDVIEATPNIVKGARKIFARTEQAESSVPHPGPATAADGPGRIVQLEAALTQLAEQQKASAQLIETLAEQNARIVEAVEILRLRTRLLMGACGALAVALVAAVVWGLR